MANKARSTTRGRALRTLPWRNASAIGLMLVFLVLAVAGDWLAPFPANETQSGASLQSPSSTYWFGTDELGRDILSRVIAGTQIAMQVAIVSVALSSVAGGVLGMLAGFKGGMIDTVIERTMDILFAFPAILLAIILLAIVGPSVWAATIAIAIVYTPRFARLARGSAMSIRGRPYIEAARLAGLGDTVIMAKHVLRNILAPLIVLAALSMSTAELAYATLSFLGLGASPPQADWGSMLSRSRNFLTTAPWLAIFQSAALITLIVTLNVFGDVMRDLFDPKARSKLGCYMNMVCSAKSVLGLSVCGHIPAHRGYQKG